MSGHVDCLRESLRYAEDRLDIAINEGDEAAEWQAQREVEGLEAELDEYEHWYPPRGSVVIEREDDLNYQARCTVCGQSDPGLSTFRASREAWKRAHRCPLGTDGALPQCPNCGSRSKLCKPGGGHGTVVVDRERGWWWCAERRDDYNEVLGRGGRG